MLNLKNLFSGALVFAYLIVGSGQYIGRAQKPDARRDAREFAASIPRKVYAYSVVPGGVKSPDELAAARRSDPVVAAHFADFGTNTRITTLQEDMYVYVSYRQGNKIYYTKKKHKVCKGELVITDGKNYARARCANRLSRVFKAPTLAFDEPSAPQFDYVDPPQTPNAVPSNPLLTTGFYNLPDNVAYNAPQQPAQTGAAPGPATPSNAFAGPGPIPALGTYAASAPAFFLPPLTNITPPPVTVPEPAEWALLAGMAAFGAGLILRKSRQ